MDMQLYSLVCVIIFGLCFGSFLNVCIARIPRGESIAFGRSHCMSCGAPIKSRDLVPVISYIVLRGRCRSCSARISPRYPLVEALNAALWAVLFVVYGFSAQFFIYAVFFSTLIVAAFIDIDTAEVSNKTVAVIFLCGAAACFLCRDIPWSERLVGLFAVSVPLLLVSLVFKGSVGFGDIKLLAAAGLVLGWKLILLAMFFAAVCAAIFGLIYMRVTHKGRETAIRLIPFVSGGCMLALLAGARMLSAYLGLFGL
jgi:leader peptidase (prepilin peptidase)/N-methyltransferase